MGTNDHATTRFACCVCCGRFLGHFYDELQWHLHSFDYIVVVTCVFASFVSYTSLVFLHRSCGEPRPTLLIIQGTLHSHDGSVVYLSVYSE